MSEEETPKEDYIKDTKRSAAQNHLGQKVAVVLHEYGWQELDLGGAFAAYRDGKDYTPMRPAYDDPETDLRIEHEVTDFDHDINAFNAPPKVYEGDKFVFEGKYHADERTGAGIYTYVPGDWRKRIEELYADLYAGQGTDHDHALDP